MTRGWFEIHDAGSNMELRHLAPEKPDEQIPEDQVQLQGRVYVTQRILNLLEGHVSHLAEYRERLRQVAGTGLTGEQVEVRLANMALDQLRESIAQREGRGIKLRYLIKLGRWALVFAALALLLYWDHHVRGWTVLQPYYLMWVGAMAGVWVSVASSRARLDFEALPDVVDHRTEPVIRLIFAGVLSWILALFLVTSAIQVDVGGLQTSLVASNPTVALLVGVLSGFTERALSLNLVNRARALVGGTSTDGD